MMSDFLISFCDENGYKTFTNNHVYIPYSKNISFILFFPDEK